MALDGALQSLLLLTQDPRSYYPELTKLGVTSSLVDLLSHENVDIALSVVQVLEELTDDDVAEGEGMPDDEDDDEDGDVSQTKGSARDAVTSFAGSLVDSQLVELATNNLARLREEEEEPERAGVFHTLGLLENLLSLRPELSEYIAQKTSLVEYLLKRLQPASMTGTANGKGKAKEMQEDPAMAQNRQYAAELLAIILQGDNGTKAREAFDEKGGVEVCLKVLSVGRPLLHLN